MGIILFLIFVLVPILEIVIFIQIGNIIGLLTTVGIVFLTAIIGTILIRHQGLATLKKAQASLLISVLPIDEVFDGLCIVVSGALLLTPGFFTDFFGFFLLIPQIREIIRNIIGKIYDGSKKSTRPTYQQDRNKNNMAGSIIDGEFEDITDDHHK